MSSFPSASLAVSICGCVLICDIAPTVLHLLGIAIPKEMDGKVLKDIFKEKSEAYKRKQVYQSRSQMKEINIVSQRVKELKRKGKI